MTVAYTSDKGLCGGINSTVTKYTRGVLRVTEGGKHQYLLWFPMHPQHASSDLDKFETMVFPMMHHMCQTALQPERGDVACIKRRHSTLQDSIQLQYVLIAEGRKSDIVVMGEKGRAQLVRLERDRILSTVNDVNKMRITFSQVSCDTTFLKCC